jgi:tripartite-type tricarboxylate transporter receptor subunit TctC
MIQPMIPFFRASKWAEERLFGKVRFHYAWCCVMAAATMAAAHSAAAQSSYPAKPVRVVVPFAPGGVNDLIGRRYAQEMARVSGGTFIVENKGGAGGTIGAVEVARAKPDGYTLLLGGTATHVINPAAMSKPAYDAEKSFAPIGVLMLAPTGVAVHPSLPARNLKQLVALAKAEPGKLTFGSGGTGTVTHLTGELFKKLGAVDLLHVPYKGVGPALIDLVAGHIPVVFPTMSPGSLSYHQTGRIRLLAICSELRLGAVPEVPAAAQAGMPGLIVEAMIAMFAPAGTPKAIIDQLHRAQAKVVLDPDFQAFLRESGAVPVTNTSPDRTAQFLRTEIARWTPIIKATGYKVD